MKKATKATIKRLKKIDTDLARILLDRIEIAQNIDDAIADGITLVYSDYEHGWYDECGLYLLVHGYERNIFSGAYTAWPSLIETTLTHGNNQVIITDVNKLSILMEGRVSEC